MHLWWGGRGRNRCIMLIMALLKLCGGVNRESRERARERGDVYTTRVQMALTLAA